MRRSTSIAAGFLTLFVLTLAPRAEAFVYWINSYGNAIGRANLDGTGVDRSFITLAGKGGYAYYAVAVNAAHVYWADAGGGGFSGNATIGRANLDGTGVDPNFIADAGHGRVNGVAVDAAHVYWAGGPPSDTSTIARANLDGTGVDHSFITGLLRGPLQVAVDSTHVYWADSDTIGTIGRANLDGSGVDQDFIPRTHPRQSGPTGVAVDAEHVYWANFVDMIGRARRDGTGVDLSFITVGGNVNLSGVAVDDEHVYWGNQGAKKGTIGRAKLNGKGVDKRFIAGVEPSPSGVAVDPLRSFSFSKAKRNKRRGTAKLTMNVPRPGELELANTTEVKGAKKRADAKGKASLPVKPTETTKRKLKTKGKAKVEAEVTYTPRGGNPNVVANTLTKTVKLIKRG